MHSHQTNESPNAKMNNQRGNASPSESSTATDTTMSSWLSSSSSRHTRRKPRRSCNALHAVVVLIVLHCQLCTIFYQAWNPTSEGEHKSFHRQLQPPNFTNAAFRKLQVDLKQKEFVPPGRSGNESPSLMEFESSSHEQDTSHDENAANMPTYGKEPRVESNQKEIVGSASFGNESVYSMTNDLSTRFATNTISSEELNDDLKRTDENLLSIQKHTSFTEPITSLEEYTLVNGTKGHKLKMKQGSASLTKTASTGEASSNKNESLVPIHIESKVVGIDYAQPKLYTVDDLHKEFNKKVYKRGENPVTLVNNKTVVYDPLRSSIFNYKRGQVKYNISVPYLGVLIDGGRHYFPIKWLKRAIDRLSDMKYNLIHLRLTDDQAFNVLLESHPELAYPTVIDNPDRRVWTVPELRELVRYAKARNIEIMPEINVPGHAGAWAGIPGLVVSCPEFTCQEGYGLPLNLKHPDLKSILTDILNETMQIFEPPFLHLGGDELDVAEPCLREANRSLRDYVAFEVMLQGVLNDLGIPPSIVVRWEWTGAKSRFSPHYCGAENASCSPTDKTVRAGGIEHMWESYPYHRHNPTPKYFLSNRLYLDTMEDEYQYDVYRRANRAFFVGKGVVPHALIAGTFELSPQFWYDRNVLGRLLAISMGAANFTFENVTQDEEEQQIIDIYERNCKMIGLGDTICSAQGRLLVPAVPWRSYWSRAWRSWKSAICGRLTEVVSTTRHFKPMHLLEGQAKRRFDSWSKFTAMRVLPAYESANTTRERQAFRVQHVGVIADTTTSLVPLKRLLKLLAVFERLNFDIMIMRIAGNNGFTVRFPEHAKFGFSMLQDPGETYLYSTDDLFQLVKVAEMKGIEIIPEISFKTNAAGWYGAGHLADCPTTLCNGGLVANDITKSGLFSVVFSIIDALRGSFPSKYLHLGHDDRQGSQECFDEANIDASRYHDRFEKKLKAILEFTEIDEANILRYENGGHDKYESRAGGILHYPAGTKSSDITTGEPFFVTVNVLDGSPFEVYQRTNDLVDLGPLGIVAELRHLASSQWHEYQIFERLVAFSLATTLGPHLQPATPLSESDFESAYKKICMEKRPHGVKCAKVPGQLDFVNDITQTEAWRHAHCSLRTDFKDIIGAKNATAYFSESKLRNLFKE